MASRTKSMPKQSRYWKHCCGYLCEKGKRYGLCPHCPLTCPAPSQVPEMLAVPLGVWVAPSASGSGQVPPLSFYPSNYVCWHTHIFTGRCFIFLALGPQKAAYPYFRGEKGTQLSVRCYGFKCQETKFE